MKQIIALFLLILPAAGCVATGKFKAKQAEADFQKKRADGLDSQLSAAKKEIEGLKASQTAMTEASAKVVLDLNSQIKTGSEQLASLSTQLGSVKKSNKDLQQSLEANQGELSKKVGDLIKQKDAVAQKLADASSEMSVLKKTKDIEILDLTQKLAAAQEATRALEAAKAAELEKVKNSYEQLTAGLKSEINAGEITITQLKGKLTVNMVDRILFDPGQAEVKADGKKVLEKVGGILNSVQDKDIRIEGHTDNKPIGTELRNKYPTNWELSATRATVVARYLQDNAKVEPKRLVVTGYGEFRPIAPNDTPENRALNRRIEIVLVPRE